MNARVFKKVQGKKVVTSTLLCIFIFITFNAPVLAIKTSLSSTSSSTFAAPIKKLNFWQLGFYSISKITEN